MKKTQKMGGVEVRSSPAETFLTWKRRCALISPGGVVYSLVKASQARGSVGVCTPLSQPDETRAEHGAMDKCGLRYSNANFTSQQRYSPRGEGAPPAASRHRHTPVWTWGRKQPLPLRGERAGCGRSFNQRPGFAPECPSSLASSPTLNQTRNDSSDVRCRFTRAR